MKRRKQSNQNTSQNVALVEQLGLSNHPIFIDAIEILRTTGDSTLFNQIFSEQMPAIQQWMMQIQAEAQKTEADPFYPRPTLEMFSGDIPVAHIPDEFGEEPGMFIMTIADLMRHTFVCGSPGEGKSRFELGLIQTLKADLGDKLTIWVFEPKSSFRRFLFPEFKIITFQDMREDLFRTPTPKVPDYTWRRIVVDVMGTEQHFQDASKNHLILLLQDFEKNGIYPTTTRILEKLQKDVKDTKSFRVSDPINSLINRFGSISEYDYYSRKVHIPIEDMMRTDMVIEIGDSNIENDKFRAALLMNRLYHYKKHHRDTRHYNLIIMDEGRDLFNQTSKGFGESKLERMFALAREMNIGFIVATQEPKSVSTAIKANVRTMIAFPLSDGKEHWDASASLNLNKQQREYYQELSSMGHGHAIVKYGGAPRAFPVKFPDVPDPQKQVTQKEIDMENDKFLRQYTIPDPPPKPQPRPQPPPLILKDEERMLRIIHENPMTKVTDIYGILDLNQNDGNKVKQRLLNKSYIEEEEVKIKKGGGRTPKFMRLTPLACQKLKLKPRAESRAGIKHEIYCRLVKQKLKDQGWTCEFEGQTNNHPHKMDVLAQKDGHRHDYEITIHLKNIQDNINNALGSKLADKVIIVADDIEKCRRKTADEQKKYGDALEFRGISEFYIE